MELRREGGEKSRLSTPATIFPFAIDKKGRLSLQDIYRLWLTLDSQIDWVRISFLFSSLLFPSESALEKRNRKGLIQWKG